MSGYTECIGCKHERLCDICPYWNGQSGTKMAERISATIGQENIRHNWTGEYPPQLDRRISATIGQENITRPNERNVEQK